MKQMILPITVALFALSSLSACAPEEAAVCEHIIEVMSSNNDRPRWTEDVDLCVDHMQKTKKRYGVNSYRRETECFLAADTSFKLKTCIDNEARRR